MGTEPSAFSRDASVLKITGENHWIIAQAQAFGAHGEIVKRDLDANGFVSSVWIGGGKLVPEAALKAEVHDRYRAKA